MKWLLVVLVCAGLSLAARCQPEPITPTPEVDAGADDAGPTDAQPSDPYTAACLHLQLLGCPEGSKPTCATALEFMVQNRLVADTLPGCYTLANTRDQARACGNIACQWDGAL